ncbi:hypothetical protein B296_00025359 [Ensete ventricosum]|uniref:Uncharacterized protein n=1 Tax=Ensete ventricosum TaxID=4639 RepID=A0A426ZEN0_ENSVE|nr:hypothetical protein B296_00025359 [Ensete ventricosum]
MIKGANGKVDLLIHIWLYSQTKHPTELSRLQLPWPLEEKAVFTFYPWMGGRGWAVPAEELFYHLQRQPLLLVHSSDRLLGRRPLHREVRRRRHHRLPGVLSAVARVAELHGHDPAGAVAGAGAFLPHPDVRLLGVEPEAGEGGGGGRLAALAELGAEDLRQGLGGGVGGGVALLGKGHREVGLRVAPAHEHRGLVVGSGGLLCRLEGAKPHPSLPARNTTARKMENDASIFFITLPHIRYYSHIAGEEKTGTHTMCREQCCTYRRGCLISETQEPQWRCRTPRNFFDWTMLLLRNHC